MTVLRRSVASWQGVDVWFALAAYFTILLLPLLVTGFLEDILGEVISKIIALLATSWLIVLFFIVTPFRLWREERYRMNLVEEAGQPKINVNWRFNQKHAELILTNISTRTINGLEVLFRNYRNADGSNVQTVLHSLMSKDGKHAPITMNPLVPTYFSFARLIKSPEESKIWLLPDTDATVSVRDEVGVKLGISGTDILNQNVDLRLKTKGDFISMEPWDVDKKAVSDAGASDE